SARRRRASRSRSRTWSSTSRPSTVPLLEREPVPHLGDANAEELVLLAGAVDVPALALVEAARARVVLEHPQEGLRAALFPQLFDRRSHESRAGAAPPRLRQRVDRAQLARAEGHEADDAAVVVRHEDRLPILQRACPCRDAARSVDAGEALGPEDVLVGGLPRAHVHGRDLGGVGDRRPADLHYFPAEDET